ncbi:hypothetical protein P691DRAFT_767747 [Macrolepiota fuliginosa MF-IS2]|uniref:Uncharacterized protein n=1 Tax=Macrolepiota fuliginosa MF-IS2 TaxID=1400762 RepID=A0A9P5WZ87_9AGAR|nr:hypothetical protein P691DRAFT_767747 [Macrolepiota fuliginosa MF-IS2]
MYTATHSPAVTTYPPQFPPNPHQPLGLGASPLMAEVIQMPIPPTATVVPTNKPANPGLDDDPGPPDALISQPPLVKMASTTKNTYSHPVDNNPKPGHIPLRWGKKQCKCKAPAVVEQSCHSSHISKPPSKIITPTTHTGQELPKKTYVSDQWCWDAPTDAAPGTIPGMRKHLPPPTMNKNCPHKRKHQE